jgi:hypothetical protein
MKNRVHMRESSGPGSVYVPSCGSKSTHMSGEWCEITCGHCWAEVFRDRLNAEEPTAPEPIEVDPDPFYAVGKNVLFDDVQYRVDGLTDDFGTATLQPISKPGVFINAVTTAKITVAISMLQPLPAKPPKTFRERVVQAMPSAPNHVTSSDEEWTTWICDLLAAHVDSRESQIDTLLKDWGLIDSKWQRDALNGKIRGELRG